MRTLNSILILGFLLLGIGQIHGDEQAVEKVEVPRCPMVASPAKEGLFQVIEVIGPDGEAGVGEPNGKVRLKCTIVNLTKRALMVAENYVTPQFGSWVVHGGESDGSAQAKVPAITPSDDVLMSSSIDLPRGSMDWGHIRNWSHIAASHDIECGCCIRHRQYTKWLDLQLPGGDWSSVTLELTQWVPVIFLGPEEHSYLESDLVLTIKRKTDQGSGGKPDASPRVQD